jgi:glucokinase
MAMPDDILIASSSGGDPSSGTAALTAPWAFGSAAGRIQAALGPATSPVVAIDLGGTHMRAAITGPSGFERLIVKRTADLPSRHDQSAISGVIETVEQLITSSASEVCPSAIGVAVAAYVDHSGVILQSRPFGIPAGGSVRDRLSERFGVPVIVDNDANLAAVAEVTAGAGGGLRNVAVITLGTNVGLGIVADGRILRGAHGAAGEAGTLLIPARRGPDGRAAVARAGRLGFGATTAPAGYALLEELVGGGALLRSTSSPADTSLPASKSNNGAAARGIFPLALAGDRRARSAVRHAIEGWAMLIADLAALLDPDAFVLSGGLIEEATAFIEPLRRRAEDLCPLPPDIRIGDLGAQSGLVGAVVATRSFLEGRPLADRLDGPDRRTNGRTSGYVPREVER